MVQMEFGPNSMTKHQTNSRLDFLDGIRGWGALVVCLQHAFTAHLTHGWWYMPIMVVLNGNLAVMMFFTVSGIALSASFVS